MKNTTNLVRTLCEIGIFAALGFVFDELQGIFFGSIFPNGGSIGFAMIAVLIVAYRRGLLPGLLTGLVMGLFDIMTKAYVIHPMQVLFDYVLPYTVVGFAGLLKPFFDKSEKKLEKILWLISGAFVGGLLKFSSHYLAGVFFWADPEYFAWNLNQMNPYLYCLVYNIAFIGPSIVITAGLLVVVYLAAPKVLTNKPFVEDAKSETWHVAPIAISTVLMTAGTFLFVFFFILWLKSFQYKASSQKYSFDQDSMVIFVLGIFFAILGVITLTTYLKNKFNYMVLSSILLVITIISLIYAAGKLGYAFEEEIDPTKYWVWLAVSGVGFLLAEVFFVVRLLKRRQENELEI